MQSLVTYAYKTIPCTRPMYRPLLLYLSYPALHPGSRCCPNFCSFTLVTSCFRRKRLMARNWRTRPSSSTCWATLPSSLLDPHLAMWLQEPPTSSLPSGGPSTPPEQLCRVWSLAWRRSSGQKCPGMTRTQGWPVPTWSRTPLLTHRPALPLPAPHQHSLFRLVLTRWLYNIETTFDLNPTQVARPPPSTTTPDSSAPTVYLGVRIVFGIG